MKAIPRCLALLLVLAWLGTGGVVRAQAPIYTASTTTAPGQADAVHFLQIINLAQGPGTYAISTLTFGAAFTSADEQKLLLYFYTGVDTSPSSANVLASATLIDGRNGPLTPPAAGNYTFTYPSSNLVITTDSSGSIAVEFFLVTPEGGQFSPTATGRFTVSAPTLGTAAGYVWNDATPFDNAFSGVEQTRFGMTNANVRFGLSGTLIQPAVKTFARNGTTATLTIDSYNGVSYQLQRATSLTASDWTNVGNAAAGSSGTVLTFTDTDGTDPQAFYRVVTTLPASSPRAARKPAAPERRATPTLGPAAVRPD